MQSNKNKYALSQEHASLAGQETGTVRPNENFYQYEQQLRRVGGFLTRYRSLSLSLPTHLTSQAKMKTKHQQAHSHAAIGCTNNVHVNGRGIYQGAENANVAVCWRLAESVASRSGRQLVHHPCIYPR